ncbi:MAG: hypothetical protein WC670_04165 [Pseudolabrys sp.]|jgi:hypothetical protein
MKLNALFVAGALMASTAIAQAEIVRTVGKGTVACSDYTAMNFFWEMTKAGKPPKRHIESCFILGSSLYGPAEGVVIARVGDLLQATWDYARNTSEYWVIAGEVEVVEQDAK